MIIEPCLRKRLFPICYRRQSYMKLFVKAREKNYSKATKFWCPFFVFINFVPTSERVPFCYRLILERIRSVRYLTTYDLHQVNIESVKKVMLSQIKTIDRHFSINPVFYQSQYFIENWFLRYLQHNNDSM